MSVINKVLSDLHKRQQHHNINNLPQSHLPSIEKDRIPWGLIFIAVFCLFLGALGMSGWTWWQQNQIEALASTPQSAIVTQAKLEAAEPVLELMNTNVIADAAAITDVAEIVESEDKSKSVTVPIVIKNEQPSSASNNSKIKDLNSIRDLAQKPTPKANLSTVEPSTKAVKQAGTLEIAPQTKMMSSESKTLVKPIKVTALSDVKNPDIKKTEIRKPVKPSPIQGEMSIKEVSLSPRQIVETKIKKAQRLESQGLLDDAINLYSESLQYDAGLHFARRQLAALYYGQGRLNDAVDILEQGFALYPKEYQYALLLSKVQQSAGDQKAALQSLALIPNDSEMARQKWLHQGDLAQKTKQFSVAESAYRQLLQREPSNANWWMALAYAVDSQGRYAQAVRLYQKALSTSGLSVESTQFVNARLAQLGVVR